MTYQFLYDYLNNIIQTMMPTSRKFKLTLDDISYRLLMSDIKEMFPKSKTDTIYNIRTINTKFGEVQIVCRPIRELYHKLEIIK